jgi:hypothetical protein
MLTEVLLENVKGRGHLEDLGIGERVIIKWVVKKQGVKM